MERLAALVAAFSQSFPGVVIFKACHFILTPVAVRQGEMGVHRAHAKAKRPGSHGNFSINNDVRKLQSRIVDTRQKFLLVLHVINLTGYGSRDVGGIERVNWKQRAYKPQFHRAHPV